VGRRWIGVEIAPETLDAFTVLRLTKTTDPIRVNFPEGREPRREVVLGQDLDDAYGIGKALERDPAALHIGQSLQLLSTLDHALGAKHLARSRQRAQPRRQVEGSSPVVTPNLNRFPRIQSHSC
jgi:hypothetical protein